jgi:hypothetical protein
MLGQAGGEFPGIDLDAPARRRPMLLRPLEAARVVVKRDRAAASRVTEAPYVRPVAMVLNGKPLAGIYITASNDHVFIGEVCVAGHGSERGNAATGSLVDVPRDEISLMMIGNNAGLEQAIQREQSLLQSLPRLARITGTQIAAVAPTQGQAACTGPSAALMAR